MQAEGVGAILSTKASIYKDDGDLSSDSDDSDDELKFVDALETMPPPSEFPESL